MPIELDRFVSTKIFYIALMEMWPWSYLNSEGLELCCTNILLFSNVLLCLYVATQASCVSLSGIPQKSIGLIQTASLVVYVNSLPC